VNHGNIVRIQLATDHLAVNHVFAAAECDNVYFIFL
jgi:hypothetical protein